MDLAGVSTEGKGGLLGRVYKERPKRFWYLLVCLEEISWADDPAVEGRGGVWSFVFWTWILIFVPMFGGNRYCGERT